MKARSAKIADLANMANKLTQEWSWDLYRDMFSACIDWNSEHEDEEIFMCEECFNGSETVNGVYIEDDYWIFEED